MSLQTTGNWQERRRQCPGEELGQGARREGQCLRRLLLLLLLLFLSIRERERIVELLLLPSTVSA